jgi:DNA-directed RNA polymerase subunit F
MSSKKTAADPFDLDLERDMPLTDEDLEALARARNLRLLSPEDYQRWVDEFEKHHGVPRRLNTADDEPFTL